MIVDRIRQEVLNIEPLIVNKVQNGFVLRFAYCQIVNVNLLYYLILN